MRAVLADTVFSPCVTTAGAVPIGRAGAMAAVLDDQRLHLQHGPIDLLIRTWGTARSCRRALDAAGKRFGTLLPELVDELPGLRQARNDCQGAIPFSGATARRMAGAVDAFSSDFVTPMAAVAGSVADEMLHVMRSAAPLMKCLVNNGGDIALWNDTHEALRIGIHPLAGTAVPATADATVLGLEGPGTRAGIATSGWSGRSFSFGIADHVTVIADNAANADVAATLIANAVNVDAPGIRRRPANELDPDSDLGPRRVTVHVGKLHDHEIRYALEAGRRKACEAARRGLIRGALLTLRGASVPVGCFKAAS